ncbi:LysM peptidoglycan-binding domain-containing protein [Candidatus Saccharibacteria bacterium]|nr:LysM peptidoglycan-binding domain-containing protein [Candidatus Saccharibacteria bacterium]
MTKKKRKFDFKKAKEVLPYVLTGVLTLGIVFFGSLDKTNGEAVLSLDAFAASDYNISVDQLSELYVVADLSNAIGLASASDVAANYVVASTMYEIGQTSTGKIEKPSITNITASRGVVEYVVAEGETMESIAAKYGVSTDQIRWSNGLKTTAVAAGTTLYIPSTSGIVYVVKAGETAESIASKYGGSAAEIIALNDLEVSGVSEGMRILIKNGSLPEKERPEYVAPVIRTYTYTYLGDTSTRVGLTCNRSLGAGQCTTWGWIKRPDLAFLRTNANRWDDMARAAGLLVDKNPAAGAIFQTDSGWYGHVGYVESVNADGSINVSERNYSGCYGVLFSTIPASEVGKFNYIH